MSNVLNEGKIKRTYYTIYDREEFNGEYKVTKQVCRQDEKVIFTSTCIVDATSYFNKLFTDYNNYPV